MNKKIQLIVEIDAYQMITKEWIIGKIEQSLNKESGVNSIVVKEREKILE